MITVSRSPLRISFFGGGSDYPSYFENFPGGVLGTAINKYVYTAALPMVGFAETRYRITYREVEAVDRIDQIKHNVIRSVLTEHGYDDPLNIAILSDIPGNSGLGSSSSFTVGFIRLMDVLHGKSRTKLDLVREAVRIERDVLHENVGIQDQTHAAFGGLNYYKFHKNQFEIHPIQITTRSRMTLNESLCLVFTGVNRHASAVLEEQLQSTKARKLDTELAHLAELCETGRRILESDSDSVVKDLGRLLSEGWEVKRRLSSSLTNSNIDQVYATGMNAGAYGGKLCGAGSGGFFLFIAPPEAQVALKEAFGAANFVKIEMEDEGARILRY